MNKKSLKVDTSQIEKKFSIINKIKEDIEIISPSKISRSLSMIMKKSKEVNKIVKNE